MKSLLILFNNFCISDGVARSALQIANNLGENEYDVTIMPLFRYDRDMLNQLNGKVRFSRGIGFYFRGFAKILNLIPSRLLYWFYIREAYDIEVGFQSGLATQIIANSPNKTSVKIGWMHGFDEKMQYLNCYNKFNYMINVSREGSERLKNFIENPQKCSYLYNIIDESYILQKAQEDCEMTKDCFSFISVGRLSPEKGFDKLIECIASLVNAYNLNVKLWLVGDGSEMIHLQRIAKELDVEKNIIFFGEQLNPYKFISQADVFVCSSYSEGFSTVCNEAAILGVPIISTNVGGAKEILEMHGTGRLVFGYNEMLESMKEVVASSELFQKWKILAQENAKNFYSCIRVNELKTKFYKFVSDNQK